MAEISEDDLLQIQEKIDKLKQSKFKQQMLPAWRPVPSFGSTMIIFGIFGFIFLALGVTLYIMSNNIQSVTQQYDQICTENGREIKPITEENSKPNEEDPCGIVISIEDTIEPPIYVYYQLDNFYQNHRRYVKSRSNKQLLGNNLSAEELKDDCSPIVYNSDIGRFKSIGGQDLVMDQPAFPCGLVAKSLFNDTFSLYEGTNKDENARVDIDLQGIAWESDKENKFFNLPDPSQRDSLQWTDIEKDSFIVWMRTAGLPNFRKLYGKIKDPLEQGQYYLEIINNFDVSSFEGSKHFVLSTTNVLGGQNYFLAICYIIVGGLCLMFAVIFFIAYMGRKGQNAGGAQNGNNQNQ